MHSSAYLTVRFHGFPQEVLGHCRREVTGFAAEFTG